MASRYKCTRNAAMDSDKLPGKNAAESSKFRKLSSGQIAVSLLSPPVLSAQTPNRKGQRVARSNKNTKNRTKV